MLFVSKWMATQTIFRIISFMRMDIVQRWKFVDLQTRVMVGPKTSIDMQAIPGIGLFAGKDQNDSEGVDFSNFSEMGKPFILFPVLPLRMDPEI